MRWRLYLAFAATVVSLITLTSYFAFNRGLVCTPLLTSRCFEIAWEQLGDFLLFRWAYHWQPLLAGLTAILAAAIGGLFLTAQTRLLARHEKDRHLRGQRASRATMPLVLSILTRYARSNGRALRKVYDQAQIDVIPENVEILDFEHLPSETLKEVQQILLSASDDVLDAFASILRRVQVHEARISSLAEEVSGTDYVVTKVNIQSYIFDAAYIHSASENLFDYARGKTEEAPAKVSWENIQSALRRFGCIGQKYDELAETVNRRRAAGQKP